LLFSLASPAFKSIDLLQKTVKVGATDLSWVLAQKPAVTWLQNPRGKRIGPRDERAALALRTEKSLELRPHPRFMV